MPEDLKKLERQAAALANNIQTYTMQEVATMRPLSQAEGEIASILATYPELQYNLNSPKVPPGVRLAFRQAKAGQVAEKGRADLYRAEIVRMNDQLNEVQAAIKKQNPKYITKADVEAQKRKDARDVTKILADRNSKEAAIRTDIKDAENKVAAAKGIRDSINTYGRYPDGTPPRRGETKASLLANAEKNLKSAQRYLDTLNDDLKYLDQRNQTKEKTLNAQYYAALYAGDKAKVAEIEQEKKLNEEYKRTLSTAYNNQSYAPGYAYQQSKGHGAAPFKYRPGLRGQPVPLRGR